MNTVTALQLLLGIWRGMLTLPDATLPFNFETVNEQGKIVMILHNAEERIRCTEVRFKGDSIIVRMPVFDSELHFRPSGDSLKGVWINYGRKGTPVIPFTAKQGEDTRFDIMFQTRITPSVAGRWETWFDAGTPDSSKAVGVFKQQGNKVTGTFLTESGDHRFVEGIATYDSIKLSVFDGSHAWLYLAKLKDGKMNGMFYSGNHHKAPFHARRNEMVDLKDADSLAGFEGAVEFSLPDTDSKFVSLTDARFRNRPVIIQILGTWCPNCMDETAYLSEFYKQYKDQGMEIVGLAFERTTDFKRASSNVKRMMKRYDVQYPVLIAGQTGKGEVEKVLPGLKNFSSFPTTILIDRYGKVARVHTGFNGPATGMEYELFKEVGSPGTELEFAL